ncbi:MAG: SLC13 family permease [Chloroflexi bacterium]|nr:SLC13 family permease [Chloroflexota bacterium]
MPLPVTPEQALFLALLVVAIVLLVSELVRPDLVAVLIILGLAYSHLLSVDEAFSGLKSEPAVVIACMFVLSAGLQTTGISDLAGRWIANSAGKTLTGVLAVLVPAAALASSVTHHVAITAVMLPITLTLAREREIAPSKLLMPVAIASSLGTSITVLGAPSFLVTSELLRQAGHPGLGVFSPMPIGLALTIVGSLYILLTARFLLPVRHGLEQAADKLRLDQFFTELRVVPNSPLIGRTVDEVQADRAHQFTIVGDARNEGREGAALASKRIDAGDVLLIRATPDELASMRQEPGWELEPLARYADELPELQDDQATRGADVEHALDKVVQAVVAPRSSLEGRTVGEIDFRHRFRVLVLGLWRRRRFLPRQLSRIALREGDVLVLEGGPDALARLTENRDFLLLTPFQAQVRRPNKAVIAGIVMLGAIVLATLPQVGLGLGALTGAAAMVLTGCLTPRQAYRSVDVRMYLFVAGAIPLGLAMKSSGTAELLAGLLRGMVAAWDERLILLAMFVFVGVIVQFMGSDSATVALFGPIAIALASTLGHAPEAYVVTVAIAAMVAILTPMSHHNLIIYAPGGYRFFDYARMGAPLTLLLGVVTAVLAPMLWSA